MRDDISQLNIPASAKRYARMRGKLGTSSPGKLNLYMQMVGDLVNQGKTKGFANKDAGKVQGKSAARRVIEAVERA